MLSKTSNVIEPSSSTILVHRSVAFTIGRERGGYREWEVFAQEGPIGAANSGVVRAKGGLGSFRVATLAAQEEIDRILGPMQMVDATALGT